MRRGTLFTVAMSWVEFADKHADGLGILALIGLVVLGITIGSVADSFARRRK